VTEEPVTEPVAEPLPERPPPAPWYAMLLNPYVIGGLGLVLVGLIALMLSRRRAAASDSSPLRYDSSKLASAMAATQASAAGDELGDDERLERLVAAVAREPANLARHLDLVRFYYETGDAAGFENAAEAMYTRVYDPDDLSWKQVLAMGREIAPEHPLFVTNFDPPVDPIAHASASREIEWGTSSAAMPDTGTTQQMRIDDVKAARAQTSGARDLPQSPPKPVSSSFNFEPARTPVEPPPGESDAFIDADAASTKLELARAYLDMGDVEGARGMLEEVVNEGNPGQRAEAKRLLDEIR
jgi:pilus assembly protein FimV